MSSNEENLNPDEQRIAELIGTLRRADAPRNFDTSVRARIAERHDQAPRTFWRPALVGVATVALLAFAGYFGMRSLSPSADKTPMDVAATASTEQTPAVQKPPQIIAPAPTPAAAPQAPNSVASTNSQKNNKLLPPAQQGGSVDEALKDAPHKVFVRNFDPSPRKAGDTGGLGGQIPVTMIFEAIGIHASWSDTGWRVDSVAAKNVADRAGIRSGDVIEAINGQPVSERASFKGSFSAQSLRVRRDGSVKDILFKP